MEDDDLESGAVYDRPSNEQNSFSFEIPQSQKRANRDSDSLEEKYFHKSVYNEDEKKKQ